MEKGVFTRKIKLARWGLGLRKFLLLIPPPSPNYTLP